MIRFTVDLTAENLRRLLLRLAALNVALAASTAIFILLWPTRFSRSASARVFIEHVLVQGHLATENVLAAWYSSMLLLGVALAALLAFHADARRTASRFRWGWLIVMGAFLMLSIDEIGSFHERVGMVGALSPIGDQPAGWMIVLAIPILLVAAFFVGFGWVHMRGAPGAFLWVLAGTLMFVADPLFELMDAKLTEGTAATTPAGRATHVVLIVLEEGGLELFGIVCFLTGVLTYVRFAAGERSEWSFSSHRAKTSIRLITVLGALGIVATTRLVRALPPADGGIPANWFPAAMFFLVFLAALLLRNAVTRVLWWSFAALAVSGYCGAGLYGYSKLLHYGQPHVALLATVIAGWVLEGTLTGVPSSPTASASRDRRDR